MRGDGRQAALSEQYKDVGISLNLDRQRSEVSLHGEESF